MTAPPWRCPYCRAKPNEPCWEGKRSRIVEPHRARLPPPQKQKPRPQRSRPQRSRPQRPHPPRTRWRNSEKPTLVDEQNLLPKNVWTRIEFTEHCWTWRGGANGRGYGCVRHKGRTRLTHRLVYELLVGPVPSGLQIDHLCLNKLCCNPTHLEPVTPKQNVNRYHIAKYGCASRKDTADPTYVLLRAP